MPDAIERFCAYYHPYHQISEGRRRTQLVVLRAYEKAAGKPLEQTTASDLRSYLASRVELGLHPNTVRRELNAVRPFLKWCWQEGLLDAEAMMQFNEVRPPRGASGQSVPKPYTREDLTKFWRELDVAYPLADEKWLKRWRSGSSNWNRVQEHAKRLQLEAIVALALYGGLRRTEIYRLEVEEMHYESDYIVVHSARKNSRGEEIVRAVPIIDAMREPIEEWLRFREELSPPHEQAWMSLHTRAHYLTPMSPRTFGMLLHDIGSGWEYHRMRHTAATEMLRAGMELELVSRILGHATLQQTLAYTELLKTDLRKGALRSQAQFSRAVSRIKEAA